MYFQIIIVYEIPPGGGGGGSIVSSRPNSKYRLFTLDLEVSQNIAQYPLHHDTYAHAKFKVATSNCLGRDEFTQNTVFDLDIKVT